MGEYTFFFFLCRTCTDPSDLGPARPHSFAHEDPPPHLRPIPCLLNQPFIAITNWRWPRQREYISVCHVALSFLQPRLTLASMNRWDLQKGPIRHMDRLPIAHSGPVLALDWSNAASSTKSRDRDSAGSDDATTNRAGAAGSGGGVGTVTPGGWMVSGGLDRTVKVRCLLSPFPGLSAHF